MMKANVKSIGTAWGIPIAAALILWLMAMVAATEYQPRPGEADNTAALHIAAAALGIVAMYSVYAWGRGFAWLASVQDRERLATLTLAHEALVRLDPRGMARPVTIADGVLAGLDRETRAIVACFVGILHHRFTEVSGWWEPAGLGLGGRIVAAGEPMHIEVATGSEVLELEVKPRAGALEIIASD